MEQEATVTFWDWIASYSDSITFIIAVISFGLSVYNFVISIIQNSTRLNVEYPHFFRYENGKFCADVMHLKVYNLSKVPVVIACVSVSSNYGIGRFGTYRKQVVCNQRTVGGRIISENEWMSDLLPIKIEANGCVNLLLIADENRRIFDTSARNKIKIYTAKRTIIRTLPAIKLTDSELLTECREPSWQ